MNADRLRKSVVMALGALFALQLYFVQELVAALLLLGAVFVGVALFTAVIFVMQAGGQRVVAWVESRLRAALTFSRRAPAFAAALSKKTFHRPHSPPAR